jgi:hypothetical protein
MSLRSPFFEHSFASSGRRPVKEAYVEVFKQFLKVYGLNVGLLDIPSATTAVRSISAAVEAYLRASDTDDAAAEAAYRTIEQLIKKLQTTTPQLGAIEGADLVDLVEAITLVYPDSIQTLSRIYADMRNQSLQLAVEDYQKRAAQANANVHSGGGTFLAQIQQIAADMAAFLADQQTQAEKTIQQLGTQRQTYLGIIGKATTARTFKEKHAEKALLEWITVERAILQNQLSSVQGLRATMEAPSGLLSQPQYAWIKTGEILPSGGGSGSGSGGSGGGASGTRLAIPVSVGAQIEEQLGGDPNWYAVDHRDIDDRTLKLGLQRHPFVSVAPSGNSNDETILHGIDIVTDQPWRGFAGLPSVSDLGRVVTALLDLLTGHTVVDDTTPSKTFNVADLPANGADLYSQLAQLLGLTVDRTKWRASGETVVAPVGAATFVSEIHMTDAEVADRAWFPFLALIYKALLTFLGIDASSKTNLAALAVVVPGDVTLPKEYMADLRGTVNLVVSLCNVVRTALTAAVTANNVPVSFVAATNTEVMEGDLVLPLASIAADRNVVEMAFLMARLRPFKINTVNMAVFDVSVDVYQRLHKPLPSDDWMILNAVFDGYRHERLRPLDQQERQEVYEVVVQVFTNDRYADDDEPVSWQPPPVATDTLSIFSGIATAPSDRGALYMRQLTLAQEVVAKAGVKARFPTATFSLISMRLLLSSANNFPLEAVAPWIRPAVAKGRDLFREHIVEAMAAERPAARLGTGHFLDGDFATGRPSSGSDQHQGSRLRKRRAEAARGVVDRNQSLGLDSWPLSRRP